MPSGSSATPRRRPSRFVFPLGPRGEVFGVAALYSERAGSEESFGAIVPLESRRRIEEEVFEMSTTRARGSCLCGAVALETDRLGLDAGACHCGICRKWGGGPLFALSCEDLRIEGEDRITLFASTAWAERGFCSVCGTHLFIRVGANGRYIVAAGLFPVEPELRFDHQIFIDRKPGFYSFAEETKDLTGEEVFAQHAQAPE